MRSAAARMPQLLALRPRLQQSVPRNDGGAGGGQGTLEFLRVFRAQRRRRRGAISAGTVAAVAGARRARSARRAVQEEKTMTTAPGAIVLAAGLGTRMRSARAKVLHELGGEPMIARVMRSLAPLAPAPLVVVVGHQGDEVAAAARTRVAPGVPVEAARTAAQRGTGDAARCGLEAFAPDFAGDVLILYGDMPMVQPATLRTFIDRTSPRGRRRYRSSARCSTTRARTVAWCATARARWRRSSRRATRRPPSLRSAKSTPASISRARPSCARRLRSCAPTTRSANTILPIWSRSRGARGLAVEAWCRARRGRVRRDQFTRGVGPDGSRDPERG